jgi:hypothetical protein
MPQITGKTVADAQLRQDIYRRMSLRAKLIYCSSGGSIESVTAKNLYTNINPVTGKFVGADEEWTVSLCGQTVVFPVKLSADGQGGTFFGVSYPGKKIN